METDSAGCWRGFQWDRTEEVCVFRPPLSRMKANQFGWKRHVLWEDSQSTNPNELQLKIRWRRGRQINTFWMRMKGKDGGKRKVACWPDPKNHSLEYQNKEKNKRDRGNKKIGRRWEKDSIIRGQPGLVCGNKPVFLHTYN